MKTISPASENFESTLLPGSILASTALLAAGAPFPLLELMHGETFWRWHKVALLILSTLTAFVILRQKQSKQRINYQHSRTSQLIAVLLIGAALVTTQRQPTIDALQRTFLPYLLGFLLVPLLGSTKSLQWILSGFLVGVVGSLVLYLTGDAVAYRDFPFFSGVWISRNSLGHVATLSLGLIVASKLPRVRSFPAAVLSLAALWLSHSKSPFLVLPIMVFALVCVWFIGASRARTNGDAATQRTLIKRGLGTIGLGSVAFVIAWLIHPELSGATRQFLTLTERTTLWKAAWDPLMRQPIKGYGLGNVFMEQVRPQLAPLTKWDSVHLHNGFLDTFAVGGLLLLIPMMMLCVFSILAAVRVALRPLDGSVALLVLVVTVLALNITEASLLNTVPHTLLMLNCVVLRSKQPHQS
jgi:O-antigen ligase